MELRDSLSILKAHRIVSHVELISSHGQNIQGTATWGKGKSISFRFGNLSDQKVLKRKNVFPSFFNKKGIIGLDLHGCFIIFMAAQGDWGGF